MEPFKYVRSKCIPVDLVNVDTDQIIPKQFLKLTQKTGFGQYLFYDWRYDKDGNKIECIFNDPKYSSRKILLTRDNFGSGSSREHAAWAIKDYGIKVIIGPSFADIFYNNCFKNGLLPIRLSSINVDFLFSNLTEDIGVDLDKQQIHIFSKIIQFDIEESRKQILLEGLDEIGLTLRLESEISKYETSRKNFW